MTTNQNSIKNNVRSTSLLPALYKMEYPNCRTGMFSLRAPYKNISDNENKQQFFTHNSTPHVAHPEYLHADQSKIFKVRSNFFLFNKNFLVTRSEQAFANESSRCDAEVQCSLPSLDTQERIIIPSQNIVLSNPYYNYELSPRYRVQLQLQPIQPNIYEVWDVETPPPRSIPINQPIKHQEPSIRIRSPRLVNIKSLSDDDSDDEDNIVYTHRPPRMCLPTNVRMLCARQDINTICY